MILAGPRSGPPTWGQAFGYDSTGNWSNLLSISGSSSAYTGCTQGSLSVSVNANNQITTDTYDAAGNLMTIPGTGGATYVFNSENQMTSTSNSSMNYIYDGDGNRVEKSGSKIYWYSGSEVLDETDTTGSVTNSGFNEYIYFGSNRIARRDSSANVFYYLVDQLSSSRVIAEVPSGQTTATLCYDADFEPFGGEHAYTNTCSPNYKFTSKERDSESNLDNFGARYYASTTGRFMSPDWALKPISVPYANFGDPQTLNLYTYVENSPLNRIDADGHCPPCLVPIVIGIGAVAAAAYELNEFRKEREKAENDAYQKSAGCTGSNASCTESEIRAYDTERLKTYGEGAIEGIKTTFPDATPPTSLTGVVVDQAKGKIQDKLIDSAKKDVPSGTASAPTNNSTGQNAGSVLGGLMSIFSPTPPPPPPPQPQPPSGTPGPQNVQDRNPEVQGPPPTPQ